MGSVQDIAETQPSRTEQPEKASRLSGVRRIWQFSMALILVPLIAVFVVVGGIAIFMLSLGELSGDDFRVRQQDWLGALYHSPFIQVPTYKESLLRYHRAPIAAIGTSRAGPFRAAFFSKSFVNLQSTIDSPQELKKFVAKNFVGSYRPEHLIIVLELWWFVDEPVKGRRPSLIRTTEQKFQSVFGYLSHAELGYARRDQLKTALLRRDSDRFLGIHGHLRREGFSPRGSFHYEQIVNGTRKSPDYKFSYSYDSIARGVRRFKRSEGLNASRLQELVGVLEDLRRRGIATTLVLPPFAPSVAQRMLARDYPHHQLLVAALRQHGFEVADFTRPDQLGNDDCEYIDGFHGGDVVYARMLLQMAGDRPDLSRFLNRQLLLRVSEDNRGSAAWSRYTTEAEIDFLGLGCERGVTSLN